jgi:hypothetical protein
MDVRGPSWTESVGTYPHSARALQLLVQTSEPQKAAPNPQKPDFALQHAPLVHGIVAEQEPTGRPLEGITVCANTRGSNTILVDSADETMSFLLG